MMRTHAALDGDTSMSHVLKLDSVIWSRKYRLREVQSNLACVHIKGGDEIDISDSVFAHYRMHQPRDISIISCVVVLGDALHER